MREEVVTGNGKVHLAVRWNHNLHKTLCGMMGQVDQDNWMRPVSWPKDDKRQFCKTCEKRQ